LPPRLGLTTSAQHVFIANGSLYSWGRASLDMEITYVTNKMQLIIIFINNKALHVSGFSGPSSGAREMYVQPMVLAC